MKMTKQEALDQIATLQKYVESIDISCGDIKSLAVFNTGSIGQVMMIQDASGEFLIYDVMNEKLYCDEPVSRDQTVAKLIRLKATKSTTTVKVIQGKDNE